MNCTHFRLHPPLPTTTTTFPRWLRGAPLRSDFAMSPTFIFPQHRPNSLLPSTDPHTSTLFFAFFLWSHSICVASLSVVSYGLRHLSLPPAGLIFSMSTAYSYRLSGIQFPCCRSSHSCSEERAGWGVRYGLLLFDLLSSSLSDIWWTYLTHSCSFRSGYTSHNLLPERQKCGAASRRLPTCSIVHRA